MSLLALGGIRTPNLNLIEPTFENWAVCLEMHWEGLEPASSPQQNLNWFSLGGIRTRNLTFEEPTFDH